MTDSIKGLINIILEQEGTIVLLVEAIKIGQRFDDAMYQEIAERNSRIQRKVLRLKNQIESTI